jgi:hypothetical protein
MLTLSLWVLSIYIITQGTSILITPPANATSTPNATQQSTSSASQTGEEIQTGVSSSRLITNATKTSANQTGEDIQTDDDLLDRIKRGLTTPEVQSNTDQARQKAKQQSR